ncbi:MULTISPECIES: murein hydrolase activator EnvC family protein [Niastella]|uniref:Peptidoglycan DD-metalloendopeptidase family protein n=1 Tax=Niastella soli TaxID=2821487 RepID=A0ABS3YR51_9BACT|nr:peptidoglycan DD-metalloendopeptidase family protein [Niastella soli]MBO9200399.1 peptidoglycan DD-metalloendopeptidase family protein [Niastella soli]
MLKWMATTLAALTIAISLPAQKSSKKFGYLAIQKVNSKDFYTGTGGGRKKSSSKKSTVKVKKETKKKEPVEAPEITRLSGNFEHCKGKLPWPVDKALVKIHFGPYKIPEVDVIGNNPGLTLATEPNAEVKAVFEGEVLSVFNVEGNRSVMVRHGRYFTVYANLASVNVTKGQKVTAEQLVGTADNSSDGHGEIEFILMRERTNIDPAKWIRKK